MVKSVIAIVLSLVLVIGLHELGHALAARLFGVKIKRISIGFGRPLLKWHAKNGCEWIWALWPLGGYVQLLNSRIEPVSTKDYPVCFDRKPVWMRIIVLLAGAMVNLLIAWLALLVIFMMGFQRVSPVVAEVHPASMAAAAGIQAGDQFIAIAGKEVFSWRDAGMRFIMVLGKKNVPVILEDKQGDRRQVIMNLAHWHYVRGSNALLKGLGIEADITIQPTQKMGLPFLQAAKEAFLSSFYTLAFYLVMLKQLLLGMLPFAALLGPLGLFTTMITSFAQGIIVFLLFIANLSLAVGLVNLFPIPGLDGGSIIYALLEKIRGKPVSIALEILLHRLAMIIFCVLFIQLILNDVARYLEK
ncbi:MULTISPECIES: M50 family metallopeptidase [Legionella]|uniref:Peptidase n=1 Tax=Legionella septentrionalis TaxID=2498109 RepID=A0A433JMJ8_9GAMM|nr:site-2 protease family protein [Legionella septentrionalis]MCP0914086.1 site-2 protease family protein [Legionella sp. 27cVA30]RUQ90754.1 peptidase [Legionella septentrionalis]RUR10215.1 peptidase [Legionella septentrionalis]